MAGVLNDYLGIFIKTYWAGCEEQHEPADEIINRLEAKKNYISLGRGP